MDVTRAKYTSHLYGVMKLQKTLALIAKSLPNWEAILRKAQKLLFKCHIEPNEADRKRVVETVFLALLDDLSGVLGIYDLN